MAARWMWIAFAIIALAALCLLQRNPAATSQPFGNAATAPLPKVAARIELPPTASATQARSEASPRTFDASADEIALQVIDRASGLPVADAQIFSVEWLENSSIGYQLHQGERGALTDWLEQHGIATRTNANGEARLPRAHASESQFPATVFASCGENWGLEDYSAADERVVLAIEPERMLEVHVVSREGVDAAGIDVVLRSLNFFGIQFHSRTDAAGVARFRHLRVFMRRDVSEPCEVTVCGLFVHRPQLQFAAQAELPARVELVLPPCGSLDVELLGAQGARVETNSDFWFEMHDARGTDSVFGNVQCSSPSGRTRLEWVEVEADFDASAATSGMPQLARARARGPASAGEVVSLQLRLATLPSAIFRAIDEHGAVLANQALQFTVRDVRWAEDDSEAWPVSKIVSDDKGLFRLPLPVDEAADNFRRLVEVLSASREDGKQSFFHTEFDGQAFDADSERGDAQFQLAQLIVAGRVIDCAGVPVADAQVRVYPAEDEGLDRERANRANRQVAWMVSDAAGGFEARGFFPGERLRVIANPGTQRESPPLIVPSGSSDVVLIAACRGTLWGSLLLPDGVLAYDVGVEFAGTDTATEILAPLRAELTDGAEPQLVHFSFDELRAGVGTLRVRVGLREFASIPDVLVSPGVSAQDPRLERIDLRDKLRVLRVFVETPGGAPADNGGLYAPRSGDFAPLDIRDHCGFLEHGVAHCVVSAAPVNLVIVVPGFRRLTMLAVAPNELHLRLRPPYEVTLEFHGANLPADLIAWVETLGNSRESDRGLVSQESTRDADRVTMLVRMAVAGPARVRLALSANRRQLGDWPVGIEDTDLPQKFVLNVDPSYVVR